MLSKDATQRARRSSSVSELLLVDDEAVGPASEATLCILMPVRSSNLPSAVRNVESWARRGLTLCEDAPATRAPRPDLVFFHAQSFASAGDRRLARALVDALRSPPPGGVGAPPASCFGAIRFLAARIAPQLDVYTIYPTHNFTGPNLHFLQAHRTAQPVIQYSGARASVVCLGVRLRGFRRRSWLERAVPSRECADGVLCLSRGARRPSMRCES